MTTPHTPLLILAAGQRCGSTLLQRLLTSHPGVLIWGESGGRLGRILEAAEGLLYWSQEYGGEARTEFSQHAHQGWMANLTPDRDLILHALHRFIDTLYITPATDLGRPVWGLKEVRYTLADARRLQSLYPGLAVILLIRDPRAILRSLDEWERNTGGRWTRELTEDAIHNWQRVAEDFLAPPDPDLPVLRLRYEDLLADPTGTSDTIAKHTGLNSESFDPDVLTTRVYAGEDYARLPRDLRDWPTLPASLRRLLDPLRIRSLIHACGYPAPE
ncbi:sulfotransferase [Sphaerisporangium aureirubrum]|uniref:Sulfotransferase n=1 Tax=Sphaerisporangium aureirubrum TaxID=1544736 RepID=A0ABW1NFI9_9ACTN